MLELKDYLIAVKKIFYLVLELHKQEPTTQDTLKIEFVVGNASCDMDTVFSSIMLSFLKNFHQYNFNMINKNTTNEYYYFNLKDVNDLNDFSQTNKIRKIYIPIINCNKGELFYRLDIKKLLRAFEIEEDDFIYFSYIWGTPEHPNLGLFKREEAKEISDKENSNNDNINNQHYSVLLVDHHELDYNQTFLENYVTEIYDHHKESKSHLKKFTKLTSKNIDYPRCSAISMILDEILCEKTLKYENFKQKELFITYLFGSLENKDIDNYQVIDFLVSAQLIDSDCFAEKGYITRWVEMDLILVMEILKYNTNFHLLNLKKNLTELLEKKKNKIKEKELKKNSLKDFKSDKLLIKMADHSSILDESEDLNVIIEKPYSELMKEYLPIDSEIYAKLKLMYSSLNKAKKNKKENILLGVRASFIKDRKNYLLLVPKAKGSVDKANTIDINSKTNTNNTNEEELYKINSDKLEANNEYYDSKIVFSVLQVSEDSLIEAFSEEKYYSEALSIMKESKADIYIYKGKTGINESESEINRKLILVHYFSEDSKIKFDSKKIDCFTCYLKKSMGDRFYKAEWKNNNKLFYIYCDVMSRKQYWPIVKDFLESNEF